MGEDLSFEHAEYAPGAPTVVRCGNCQGPLGDEYWKWQAHLVCTGCRGRLSAILDKSKSSGSLGKAALLGGGAAFGCGLAYAIFVAVTDIQIAFATIGIAFVIAKVVRKASGGVGGRRFQVLAVALTYVASAMGYAPAVLHALKSPSSHVEAKGAPMTPKGAPTEVAPAPPPAASPAESPESPPKPFSPFAFILALAVLFAFILAAPLLSATSAPLGLAIVGFGLWEAWKLSRRVPIVIEGPYRVAPPSTGPPVAT